MALTVPSPRAALTDERNGDCAWWYEHELGWPTEGTAPVQLPTGLRFDVLELPAAAGYAALRRLRHTGPVALTGRTMGVLVAAGSADELPGLLDWLEWGGVSLALTAIGTGGRIIAPTPPGWAPRSPGAAAWLRPPELRHEGKPELPALAGLGSRGGGAPDLVRLVDAVATECHRARLAHARKGRTTTVQPAAELSAKELSTDRSAVQPLAFS
ncbi:SCO3374 family protein [Streptomyces sp. NPDC056231]|uniref:SCO3374 family protein n=1 Tax=Streptomyces sp. NPDC056231 TaxID=3345755 RepID=UPI003AABDE86